MELNQSIETCTSEIAALVQVTEKISKLTESVRSLEGQFTSSKIGLEELTGIIDDETDINSIQKGWEEKATEMQESLTELNTKYSGIDEKIKQRNFLTQELSNTLGRLQKEVEKELEGKRILDAGCGEGFYCRKLALKKASVTGIDGSKELITLARNKKTEVKVDYKVMDLTQNLNFPDAEFDVVLANMVPMDISKIDIAIAEFARILEENGVLVFCITHPCFFCYDWVQDKKGARLYCLFLTTPRA